MTNSIKRIISVILTVFMIFSMFTVVYAEGTGATTQAVKYAKEIEIINAMGIINGDETGAFNADANLTRAEFAQVLTVILQINYSEIAKKNAWYYTFESAKDLDEVILTPNIGLATGEEVTNEPVTAEKVQKFADVDSSHWAFDVISQIADLGYMIGTSATEFSPEAPVTVNQVNKVLVKILGYEQLANRNGGYPAGFNYLASSLKVLKDINNYGENPITRGELAKMLYNMFDVNVISTVKINDEGVATYQTSKETFLSDKLGVYKYEGIVTDNGITAILGDSDVEDDEVKIGNRVFKLSSKADYVKGFIGRYVEFYAVKDDDANEQTIIYATLAKDNEEFVIAIDKFEGIGNDKIKYLDENEKIQNIDIAPVSTIIFNGTKVGSVTKSQIKAFSNGTVTVMKSGESKMYDTIVIEGFVSVYVKNVVLSEKILSNGLLSAGTVSDYASLNLSEENNKDREITYIKNGKTATFADIKSGDVVDVAMSKNAIKIIIFDKKEKVTICGKSVDELSDSYIYSDDNKEYLLAKELVNSNSVTIPELGVVATAYFNSFGEIAYFDTSAVNLSKLAILVNAVSEGRGIKKDYKVRLFTDSGVFVDYPLTEKVAFTNENDVYHKVEAKDLVGTLSAYKDTLITFSVTEENYISEIIMPLAIENKSTRSKGRIGVFYISEEGAHYANDSFDGKAFTRNTPAIFYVSSEKNAEESARYQLKTSKILASDSAATGVTAYNNDPGSLNATYLVIHSDEFTSHTPSTRTTNFFVVNSVKQALNTDGEPVMRVEGYDLNAQTGQQTFITYESSTGAFEKMISFVGNKEEDAPTYTVQEGDIINIFESNGNVEYASLVYRHTANYPKNPRKIGGALIGQYDGLFDDKGIGNPYAIGSSGKVIEVNGFTITANSATGTGAVSNANTTKMFDGFVLSTDEGLVSVTNMDLSDNKNIYDDLDNSQVTRAWVAPKYVTVIDIKGSKITARVGSINDIKTYGDYGADCSRVIAHSYSGVLYKLIVINVED